MKKIVIATLGLAVAGALWALTPREGTTRKPIVTGVAALPAGQHASGRQLFADNCAVCHGALADGEDGAGPPLMHPIYRPDHHSDLSFYRAAERGVRAHHWPFGDMPPQPQLQRQQVAQIIDYLRALQQHNKLY